MQSFVSLVSTENIDAFKARDMQSHHVLLFTDKKSTPAIFKALSKKFLQKLFFGEVRSSDEALVKQFGVTEFPTLLVMKDQDFTQFDKYSGEMKVDQLSKFLD